jgi:flagellar basal body-associated protein FliL
MSLKGNKKPASILPTIIAVLFGLIVVMMCYVFYLRAPHNEANKNTSTIVDLVPVLKSNAPAKFLRTVDPNIVFVNMTVSTSVGLGNVLIEVNKDWAPLGAPRFVELVESNFFEDARFFRVIKVQLH